MKFSFVLRSAFVLLPLFLINANAAPDAAAGARKAASCTACHGEGGNSSNALYPSLAEQTPLYLFYQLQYFRDGRRVNEQMSPFASNLSDADMKDIAAYFSAQKSTGTNVKLDNAQIAAGKAAAARYLCGSCHLPNYAGLKQTPRVAGLQLDYLIAQMRDFKSGERQDIDGTMASAAKPLSDKEIVDISTYLASLK